MSAYPIDILDRFVEKFAVDGGTGCWQWIGAGAQSSNGYGSFWNGLAVVGAHRFSYEIHVGPIPPGMTIDHLCRNRSCVNPSHLEPVTRGANVMRGVGLAAQNAKKTHCKNGHAFTEENTVIRLRPAGSRRLRRLRPIVAGAAGVEKKPTRVCRKCLQSERRQQRLRKKAKLLFQIHPPLDEPN